MIERFNRVKDRYIEKTSHVKDLKQRVSNLNEEESALTGQISDLSHKKETLDKSLEVMKVLVEEVFKHSIKEYIDLVQNGLNTIFHDRNYQFDIEVENYGSHKKATLFYRELRGNNWSNWRDVDNNSGGSIRCVIDLISRIFLITKTERQRFLIFDESLTELADDYIENVYTFLEEISERLEFDILIVSHDSRLINLAENVYEMEMGSVKPLTE